MAVGDFSLADSETRVSADASDVAIASPAVSDAIAQRQRLVTSRAAENLFWMGRYTERTENTLRLVRLSLEILSSENQNLSCLLHFIGRMATHHGLVRAGVPAAAQAHRVFERSLIAGLWDRELATSVGFNLRSVRLAAASVRALALVAVAALNRTASADDVIAACSATASL